MSQATGKPDTIKSRLLVDVLGIPTLVGIIWLGGWSYAALAGGVVLLGLREYLTLLRKGGMTARPLPVYTAALALLGSFTWQAGLWGQSGGTANQGLAFLAILLVLLMILQIWEVIRPSPTPWITLSTNLVGVLWLAGFGGSFILVRTADFTAFGSSTDVPFRLTLALYVAVWVCDATAYLMGRAYGRRKIAPQVSPNKTVMGTVSGLVAAMALMLLAGSVGWLDRDIFTLPHLVVLGLITGGIGQLGDFVESRLKRDFGVKDSGTLFPGHGGVLDRFDSLLYVMPAAYLFLALVVLA